MGWTATMIHGKKEVQKHWCIQEICLERITFICLTQEKLSYENFFHRNIKSNNAVFLCIKELQFKKCEDKFSTRIILAKTYEYQYLQIWQTLWNKVTLISKVTLIGHGSYENFFLSVHGNCVQLLKDAEATCLKIAIEMKKCSRLKEMSNFNVLWNFQPI